ncbi:MAG: Rne/Rng family ribonuclease, partial [Geodermatophilaceae bacterium]|nr:Rne/Rng family ribonuclease [Geodermatophilaceae bacterium]
TEPTTPAEQPRAGDLTGPTPDAGTPAADPGSSAPSHGRRRAAPAVMFMPPAPVEPTVADTAVPSRGRRAKAATTTDQTSAGAVTAPPAAVPDDEGTVQPARPARKRAAKKTPEPASESAADPVVAEAPKDTESARADAVADGADDHVDDSDRPRRRRGRRGRGRGGPDSDRPLDRDESPAADQPVEGDVASAGTSVADSETGDAGDDESSGTRRRRRRRRRGEGGDEDTGATSPPRTRAPAADEVQGVRGSTRLEAKRQRRRDGRDQGRRRAPILSEAEFLARRESVDRVMAVRQRDERTQIAVLEDSILVEHYVTKTSAMAFAGNVYLGRVQNVLPSMEAAFIDIGKGRNAVLYAGEVNWDAAGLAGKSRSIEQALKSGDKVLVQVSKDPIGQKGARLTSQISLPGRYLVYVPNESMTGISRKLPDTERQRLKDILRRIVPDGSGVIIRTAAEGASEEELTRDVNRLKAQWEVITEKAGRSGASAPSLLYEEPDLAIRVVRDVFNEDFSQLSVSGTEAWDTLQSYVSHVAPDLAPRLVKHTAEGDLFAELRVDEQLLKALDRKVYLPSGGSLVIDRTEAMTVIDVNTGKFIGSGGNLEQTVTRNNIEAAEEIVRQLRLRDIGGVIVIDFIDMVLETNRDLVLRRLTECLGRDRTKHQVAEVTSLGLVQMTRKRVGQGLLEAFSEPCEYCNGRGIIVHTEPVDDDSRRGDGKERSERSAKAGTSGRGSRSPKVPATADPNAPGPRSVAAATFAPSAPQADPAAPEPTDFVVPALAYPVPDDSAVPAAT